MTTLKPRHSLLILDFDDTLVTRDVPPTVLEQGVPDLLARLHKNGIFLAIASRNPPHVVEKGLKSLNLRRYFRIVMADYRPKQYQVKHIWYLLTSRSRHPIRTIVFLDDSLENCASVARLKKDPMLEHVSIHSIPYRRRPPHLLARVTNAILSRDVSALASMSVTRSV